jgi:hypothetical protein
MKTIILLLFICSLIGCGGYNKTCIGGHVYYEKNYMYAGYLAIKLNDNGKPVKCKPEK